jgi:hypothetical protein
MNPFRSIGLGSGPPQPAAPRTEHVVIRGTLQRVLAFTGRSIDDVVNSPLAKNEVLGYYKLSRFVERRGDIVELERQWNPLGF